jgi:hypothetical protein
MVDLKTACLHSVEQHRPGAHSPSSPCRDTVRHSILRPHVLYCVPPTMIRVEIHPIYNFFSYVVLRLVKPSPLSSFF